MREFWPLDVSMPRRMESKAGVKNRGKGNWREFSGERAERGVVARGSGMREGSEKYRAANVHFLLVPLVVERKRHRLALRGGTPGSERGDAGGQNEGVSEVSARKTCRKRISA